MATEGKKGLTVQIPLDLHTEVRQYIEANGMTMAEFVALALQDELHPKYQEKEENKMANMRTLAFQVPEDLFQKIKEYLQRNHMTQKKFVIGLIEDEIERDLSAREDQNRASKDGDPETEETEDEIEGEILEQDEITEDAELTEAEEEIRSEDEETEDTEATESEDEIIDEEIEEPDETEDMTEDTLVDASLDEDEETVDEAETEDLASDREVIESEELTEETIEDAPIEEASEDFQEESEEEAEADVFHDPEYEDESEEYDEDAEYSEDEDEDEEEGFGMSMGM